MFFKKSDNIVIITQWKRVGVHIYVYIYTYALNTWNKVKTEVLMIIKIIISDYNNYLT